MLRARQKVVAAANCRGPRSTVVSSNLQHANVDVGKLLANVFVFVNIQYMVFCYCNVVGSKLVYGCWCCWGKTRTRQTLSRPQPSCMSHVEGVICLQLHVCQFLLYCCRDFYVTYMHTHVHMHLLPTFCFVREFSSIKLSLLQILVNNVKNSAEHVHLRQWGQQLDK